MRRNTIAYFFTVTVFGIGVSRILEKGKQLETPNISAHPPVSGEQIQHPADSLLQDFAQNVHHPLSVLLLQILVIIIAARLLGWLMVKIGQPTVIGEIIAGILLGPSLLGWLFPSFTGFVFPPASIANLQFLSQIGLILFMFVIGMELDIDALKKTAKDALVISHSGIVFSYFLGVCLAYFLFNTYAPPNIHFLAFGLFIGNAMSITAFPVLARIIQERGLTRTAIGTLVISCAAIDDITAWCILAVVIAIVKAGSVGGSLFTVVFSAVYMGLMIFLVRPLLDRLANRFFALETLSKPIVAFIFIILLVSCYSTELIGIHALFGAFIAGVVMPSKPEFRHVLTNKIEDISQVLLLPLFFVITGLRTQIGLLNDVTLWQTCGIIITVAVIGKFFGTALTARLTGKSWFDAFTIGTLMNTRGLMELVVLNIGFDLGILSPTLFSMFVLMALITTFMTGPALDFLNYTRTLDIGHWTLQKPITRRPTSNVQNPMSVLISFGQPKAGQRLLQLAADLCLVQPISDVGFQMPEIKAASLPKAEIRNPTSEMEQSNIRNPKSNIYALHLTPSADIAITEANIFERQGFAPILAEANARGILLNTHYKATNNLSSEIIRFANSGNFSLMLVGSSRPLFSDDETGGKVHEFFGGVKCPMGVMIDRGFDSIKNVLIIEDESPFSISDLLSTFRQKNKVAVIPSESLDKTTIEAIKNFDLVAINLSAWEKIKLHHRNMINHFPTILIIG